MKAVIQRVKKASVAVDGETCGSIESGLVIFLGIAEEDTENEITDLVEMVLDARLFGGNGEQFHFSVQEKDLEILLISQYTLFSQVTKEKKVNVTGAAKMSKAKKLYEFSIAQFTEKIGTRLKSGRFGSYMNVQSDNDGPVTIVI